MRAIQRSRDGLTLVEVLVILAILATLSAALVPVVTGQLGKASVQRVVTDLNGVRTGSEAFIADIHRYPGDVDDLTTPIDGADYDLVDRSPYPTGLIDRWGGPYIDRAMPDDGSIETGFGARLLDSLEVVPHDVTAIDYLTVLVTSIPTTSCADVDETLDGGDGAATGRLLCIDGGADPDTLKYLAIPIN